MFPDGICRVTDSYYTKTVQFQDINYQLNQNEDKTAIFDGWCDFLNYFDSSVRFQLSFVNMSANKDNYARYITISPQGDDFDSIRLEYTQMLQNQLARGNNGLIKTKYLTFGVEADGLKAAKPRLERIETDILNNFKRLGVAAEPMNGTERLRLLHGMLHMDEQEPFRFSWDWLAPSGLSVKDFIAPSSFEFRTGRSFGVGRRIGCASFLQILAPELNDRMLADFLDMESSLIVSMHVQSVDQVKAIKTIKRKITDLQKMTIEEQKKAVRAGYDMDIIPSDLATYGTEAKKLLQDLQSRNERMFLLTFIVVNTAGSRQQLDNNVFQAASIAQKYNCQLTRLDFRQEEGLMSSLPLGLNQIEIQRGLTTSSVAIFIPFTTQELFQDGKEALYCGLNALSNNLIMVDRKRLKNPNGLILGTPGSGKSFAAKREIANVFLVTDDDIIICDPEAEYGPLVERLHGQVIKISPTSPHYIKVTLECGGAVFTVKGRTTLTPGWKQYLAQEKQDAALPELSEGQVLECAEAAVKEGKTIPPRHYTEDTLLSAMETAGKEDMPEEAERKGLGTPATRAAIIEKLVATGFVERKRAKKAVSLVPAHTGVSLITVLPEQLQSPLLTAEWEYRLQQVERGELSPDEFMTGIAEMLTELVKTYQVISGAEVLFPSGREVIGKCPRCGGEVSESKKGFFCEKNDCRFGLWRDNKFFAAKRAALTKKVAAALLADGRVKLTGLYSEKTGGTYDATAVLEDTGESVRFRLEFDKGART